MKYPYVLFNSDIRHLPLFTVKGAPFFLDLSDDSVLLTHADTRDPANFQKNLERLMHPDYSWGLGGYLERRDALLEPYPQMVDEKRFYHLGLDIVVPVGTPVCAPLDAVVQEAGYEDGEGNYGGYALLTHELDRCEPFYSFYGHLSVASLPKKGGELTAGDMFARIGDFDENGSWYHHTHLQVMTAAGLAEGYLSKGYTTQEDLPRIRELCPDPLPLLKVTP